MKGKVRLKTYKELCEKIRDLVRSISNNSDDYDQKSMKIKFNSYDDLSSQKILELCEIIIVLRSVFHEDNWYYSYIFLDKCLCKL